jgi:hypothetical protein
MSTQRNTEARKEALAQRAAQNRKERGLKQGRVLAHNCERGQLIAWFAKQPTRSLREFKRAIDAARLTRLQRSIKHASKVRQDRRSELKNLEA